jgi:hypothetical protein
MALKLVNIRRAVSSITGKHCNQENIQQGKYFRLLTQIDGIL